jgi:hypothetical protein
MEQLKFTIITPTLLRPTLIKACESITAQSYVNWEHLVVVDKPGADIDKYLSENPTLAHPNRKWFVCSTHHHNVGNTCRSSMFDKLSYDTDYVLYLDDDNFYLGEALQHLNSALQSLPNWGVFPMMRFGEIFFNDPPGKNRTDTNQFFHRPRIDGQAIRYLNRNEYCTDGLMVDWLKAISSPLMIDYLDPVTQTDSRGYGAEIPESGRDPYTVVIPNKFEDVINPLLASILKYRSKPLNLVVVADGHDRSYGYESVRTDHDKFIFGRAANTGIRHASPNDIILMNDDARLTQMNTFETLFQEAYLDPSIGILSPLIDGGCGNMFMKSDHVDKLWTGNPSVVGNTMYRGGTGFDYISFVCVYIKRAMLDQIGLMDELFDGYGRDDADMSMRAARAGWKIAITRKVTVKHGEGGSEFKRGKNWNTSFTRQGITDAKCEYFYQKYPDEPRIPLWPQPSGKVPEQYLNARVVRPIFKQSMLMR